MTTEQRTTSSDSTSTAASAFASLRVGAVITAIMSAAFCALFWTSVETFAVKTRAFWNRDAASREVGDLDVAQASDDRSPESTWEAQLDALYPSDLHFENYDAAASASPNDADAYSSRSSLADFQAETFADPIPSAEVASPSAFEPTSTELDPSPLERFSAADRNLADLDSNPATSFPDNQDSSAFTDAMEFDANLDASDLASTANFSNEQALGETNPWDFDASPIDQSELDRLAAEFEESRSGEPTLGEEAFEPAAETLGDAPPNDFINSSFSELDAALANVDGATVALAPVADGALDDVFDESTPAPATGRLDDSQAFDQSAASLVENDAQTPNLPSDENAAPRFADAPAQPEGDNLLAASPSSIETESSPSESLPTNERSAVAPSRVEPTLVAMAAPEDEETPGYFSRAIDASGDPGAHSQRKFALASQIVDSSEAYNPNNFARAAGLLPEPRFPARGYITSPAREESASNSSQEREPGVGTGVRPIGYVERRAASGSSGASQPTYERAAALPASSGVTTAEATLIAPLANEPADATAERMRETLRLNGVSAARVERWSATSWRASGVTTSDDGASYLETFGQDPTSATRALLEKIRR